MTAARHAMYSIEDYLRLEEYANVKHEFLDGQIYAMAGGTLSHSALATNLSAQLVTQLRGRPCRVFNSDARVRIVATGLDTYPDVSVACGHAEHDTEDKNALTNPILLVEVLSPSTEAYDRGDKFMHYKKIPTLREVVFVSHARPVVEVWQRSDSGEWTEQVAIRGEKAGLSSIDCVIDVDELYLDPLASSSA